MIQLKLKLTVLRKIACKRLKNMKFLSIAKTNSIHKLMFCNVIVTSFKSKYFFFFNIV